MVESSFIPPKLETTTLIFSVISTISFTDFSFKIASVNSLLPTTKGAGIK